MYDLTHLPWTKWLPFHRPHFQLHFLEWKVLYFDSNFTGVCSKGSNWKLEQLECLRSEIPPAPPWLSILLIHIRSHIITSQSQSWDTLRCPMIIHTSDSYQIPYHNKSKSKLQIKKICQKFWKILEFCNNLYTRLWSCLTRCANMKWIQLVLWKIQSGHDFVHRRTDRQTDRRTDDVKPVYPLSTSLKRRV